MVSANGPNGEQVNTVELAERIAESLGTDVTVGDTINVHGHSIIPLIRIKTSVRESNKNHKNSRQGNRLQKAMDFVLGTSIFVRWQSEPVALMITPEGGEPTLSKLDNP